MHEFRPTAQVPFARAPFGPPVVPATAPTGALVGGTRPDLQGRAAAERSWVPDRAVADGKGQGARGASAVAGNGPGPRAGPGRPRPAGARGRRGWS